MFTETQTAFAFNTQLWEKFTHAYNSMFLFSLNNSCMILINLYKPKIASDDHKKHTFFFKSKPTLRNHMGKISTPFHKQVF